jgi:hypothetical protein
LGFKTIVVCVNERFLDKSFVGRIIDQDFINDLPENVDVCGKTVSFIPSLLTDLFSQNLDFEVGNRVSQMKKQKESSSNTACDTDTSDAFDFGFWYCDLIEK